MVCSTFRLLKDLGLHGQALQQTLAGVIMRGSSLTPASLHPNSGAQCCTGQQEEIGGSRWMPPSDLLSVVLIGFTQLSSHTLQVSTAGDRNI